MTRDRQVAITVFLIAVAVLLALALTGYLLGRWEPDQSGYAIPS
jgi:hypothetical protein